MLHPYTAPTRSLPDRPNLAQLRRQARELLKSFRAGDPQAVTGVTQFEHTAQAARFALADAQRVLARAYSFSSWTKLKQHVDGQNIKAFCAAVDAGDLATVRRLAKSRPELVSLSPDGEFGEKIALHSAVLKRNADMTHALM